MKFLCTQENLSQGLTLVSHVTGKNISLPILNNVFVRAERGQIEFSATNLELAIVQKVRGKIEDEGTVTIPGRVIAEFVSLLEKNETITVETEGAHIVLTSGRSKTTMHGLPAEEYPLIPHVDRSTVFRCSGPALRDALAGVVFAAATDDARPEISGVYFRCEGTTLTLAATDSYRLAETSIPLQDAVSEKQTAIVPTQAVQELLRILSAEEEIVQFSLAENQIAFSYQDTDLLSRLIDGQYPNYEQIIPTAHETEARVAKDVMTKAVKAASLFTRPGIHDVTLSFDPKKNTLLLEAANTAVGENRQEVDAAVTGRENSVVFNTRYLLDGLNALGSNEVLVQMTNAASPGVFRTERGGYSYIIMPIKQ